MKLKSITPFLPLFSLFLLVGYWTGQQIAVSAQRTPPQELETSRLPVVELDRLPPTPTPPAASQAAALPPLASPTPAVAPADIKSPERPQLASRQRNLLVIGVDDLGAFEPRLESVWMAIYLPGNPHFMLLPVYPSPKAASEEQSLNPPLPQLFELGATKAPGVRFLEALEADGLWWTGYLILDHVALADVAEFLGGAGELSTEVGAFDLASLPLAAVDSQQALLGQARLLQALCTNIDRLSLEDHWRLPHLFGLIPAHAVTDLDLNQVSAEWQALLGQAGGIACEYPYLSQTSLHP